MAHSCITKKWGNNYAPQVKLTLSVKTSDELSVTWDWKLEYIATSPVTSSVKKEYTVEIGGSVVDSGTYDINGKTGTYTIASGTKKINRGTVSKTVNYKVSFDFDITWGGVYKGTAEASGSTSMLPKTSYTVSYDGNGGTGVPSNQTKWHGTNLKLSSVIPVKDGHTFMGWSLSEGNLDSWEYVAGDTYSSNQDISLVAVWKTNTFEVIYNGNGGSNVPENQTKEYGKDLVLSSVIPTLENHNFIGWALSSVSREAVYKAGDTYSKDAKVTLYAVWELAYQPPRISNVILYRCNADGAENPDGAYAYMSFDWVTDVEVVSARVSWTDGAAEAPVSGVSGTAQGVIGGAFNPDYTYPLSIVVTDAKGGTNSEVIRVLPLAVSPIEIKKNGKGVGIGRPAEVDGLCDIGFKTRFVGGLMYSDMMSGNDFNYFTVPNTYHILGSFSYTNSPEQGIEGLLEVSGSGVVRQRIIGISKTKPVLYERVLDGTWSDWRMLRIPLELTRLPTGSNYECFYCYETGMCMVRIHITGIALTANTMAIVAQVGEGYRPSDRFALATMGLQDYDGVLKAWVNTDGTIKVLSSVNKSTDDVIIVSGTWFI